VNKPHCDICDVTPEFTTSKIIESVKRHKRGVRLLDRKVPRWRQIMREHQGQYQFSHPDRCVIGTLARHAPALRRKLTTICFWNAVRVLVGSTDASAYGFNGEYDDEMTLLHDLWRMEFEQ